MGPAREYKTDIPDKGGVRAARDWPGSTSTPRVHLTKNPGDRLVPSGSLAVVEALRVMSYAEPGRLRGFFSSRTGIAVVVAVALAAAGATAFALQGEDEPVRRPRRRSRPPRPSRRPRR